MAATNVAASFGLQLFEDTSGTPLEWVAIPSTDGTALFVGDAVKLAGSSGQVNLGPYRPYVTQAAEGNAIYGVIQGFLPQYSTSTISYSRYRAASTAMYALVKPANNQDIYKIECSDLSYVLAATDVGNNANIAVGSGSTITGMSSMQLDSATINTTATLQLKIDGFYDVPSNIVGTANQVVLVRLNNIQLSGGTGTLGV
jgi:hypothetical protein